MTAEHTLGVFPAQRDAGLTGGGQVPSSPNACSPLFEGHIVLASHTKTTELEFQGLLGVAGDPVELPAR